MQGHARLGACPSIRESNVVVINAQRVTAIVIRNNGKKVTLVPMRGGRLTARSVDFDEFRTQWQEAGYSLCQALTTFLAHIMNCGASGEVSSGLARLAARDRFVVAPLF